MSSEEKSAWGSLLALAVASWMFFPMAIRHIAAGGEPVDLIFRVFFIIGVFWIAGVAFIGTSVPWAPVPPSNVMMSIYLFLALTVSEASQCMLQICFYRAAS